MEITGTNPQAHVTVTSWFHERSIAFITLFNLHSDDGTVYLRPLFCLCLGEKQTNVIVACILWFSITKNIFKK